MKAHKGEHDMFAARNRKPDWVSQPRNSMSLRHCSGRLKERLKADVLDPGRLILTAV